MARIGFLAIAIILAISFEQALTHSGIKCFSCHSLIHHGCGDTIDNSTLTVEHCPQDFCVKIKSKSTGRVVRGCANSNSNPCDVDTQYEDCFICGDKDGCNGASQCGPATAVIIVTIIIVIIGAYMLNMLGFI